MNEIEPHKPGEQTCSSDMLAALENLERMFHAYRFCMNEHAANAVLLGLAAEAQMLAIKMKALLGRWNKYLPFHEVMDVQFDVWQRRVNKWIEVLNPSPSAEPDDEYPWLLGCREYMLDLYALTDQYNDDGNLETRAPQFYELGSKEDYQREITAYLECRDRLLVEMEEGEVEDDCWRTDVSSLAVQGLKEALVNDATMPYLSIRDKEAVENLERCIRERFDVMTQFDDAMDCALIALGSLQNHLCDIQALFNKALPNEVFIRLSARLFYLHCLNSYREGEANVNKWRNSWPEAKLRKNAEKKKEELKKLLQGKPYGQELEDYIDVDSPNLFGDSSFGRFLFKNRQELRVEDVRYIHKVCRELNLLNELLSEEGESVQTHSAPIRQLTDQEREILSKVMALAKKGPWENVSQENAIVALQKALGLGPVFADPKHTELSHTLWELLKKRRGCDAEKSLMVTWLNIVGYCVKKGLMSGGSPALAKKFFPQCGSDDYKAIDKGRNAENNKNFAAVIPLLDYCFKV